MAIDELVGSLGVKEDVWCNDLYKLVVKREPEKCVQEIAGRLGLPIRISLSYAPRHFKAGDTSGFQSTALSETDCAGHGKDGITAQVSIPDSVPLFGSPSLVGYPINVRISENCLDRPEIFVTVMAHELSHVVLKSLAHPKKDSELHTDLVPILLGFRDCVRMGRKNVQHTTVGNKTTTRTTTIGYLTDPQFEFACSEVTRLLQPHEHDKQHLLELTKSLHRKIHNHTEGLRSFREYLNYLDAHLTRKIRERDAGPIVQFHASGYTQDWETETKKAKLHLDSTERFVSGLIHYTAGTVKQLGNQTRCLRLTSQKLDRATEEIDRDVKVLRRNVGLMFRLRSWMDGRRRGRSLNLKRS